MGSLQNSKVIYIHNSLGFEKSCEELSWNHRNSHFIVQKQTELQSELNRIIAVWIGREVVVRFHQMLMQSAKCARLPCRRKTKLRMKKRFVESFLDPIIPPTHKWNNSQTPKKSKWESINTERKSYNEFASVMLWSRQEFQRETFWLLTLKKWISWTNQKYMSEDWMQKKSWYTRKTDNLYFL